MIFNSRKHLYIYYLFPFEKNVPKPIIKVNFQYDYIVIVLIYHLIWDGYYVELQQLEIVLCF